jgi:hypothetical protein
MASWAHRTILAGLLLTAYLVAWTPARTTWTRAAAGALEAVASTETTVSPRLRAHVVRVQPEAGSAFSYTAPAGVKFLLPGLFLVLIAPTRPLLGAFFAGHLALGGLTLGLATAAFAGLPGGLGLADFVQSYGVDAFSLAVPVFILARRSRTFQAREQPYTPSTL